MAKIPHVDNFLFCFSLRSGILFFSSMTVVIRVIQLLFLAFIYDSYMMRFDPNISKHMAVEMNIGTAICRVAGETLGVGLAVIILHVLVIIGVLYKKPNLLLPWLAICGFGLGIMPFGMIGFTIYLAISIPTKPAFITGIFFVCFILMGWVLHLFCVVYTYYKQLKEPEESNKSMVFNGTKVIPYDKVA